MFPSPVLRGPSYYRGLDKYDRMMDRVRDSIDRAAKYERERVAYFETPKPTFTPEYRKEFC